MKKILLAGLAVLLVWNAWLTVRMIQITSLDHDNRTVVQNTVNGYTTDLSEAVSDSRGSMVRIAYGSHKLNGAVISYEKNTAYIMTCSSGLQAGNQVSVKFDNDCSATGTVLGVDTATQLALVSAATDFTVTAIKQGDSTLVNEGEYVVALGGRRDSQSAMVSHGIVSSLAQMTLTTGSSWASSVFETDAVVNEENEGGALLNMSGEMIGILIPHPYTGDTDMYYAVSINEVESVYAELKATGSVSRGNLGIVTRSISEMQSYEKSAQGIALDKTSGVLITSISSDSALDGIVDVGAQIVTIDGQTLLSNEDLRLQLYAYNAGDTVTLTVIQDDAEAQISVTLK